MTARTFRLAWIAGLVVVGGGALLARPFIARVGYHVLPLAWTGEDDRLAALLRVRPGAVVGEIGAGSGTLALEMARRVGPEGVVFATELSAERRQQIAERAARAGLAQLKVVAAAEAGTSLTPGCCDALYMRNVLHHLEGRPAYAREMWSAVRPGGVVVIIDFAPGALSLHLGSAHGVSPDAAVAAFTQAGFVVQQRVDRWGGGMFALVFAKPARDRLPA
jgi:ubiquinone/menaquinone biosynthesis C-methylase UbiE